MQIFAFVIAADQQARDPLTDLVGARDYPEAFATPQKPDINLYALSRKIEWQGEGMK